MKKGAAPWKGDLSPGLGNTPPLYGWDENRAQDNGWFRLAEPGWSLVALIWYKASSALPDISPQLF